MSSEFSGNLVTSPSMVQELKTLLCLVRHGETDWNTSGRLQGREDIMLNEAGRNQALQLIPWLKTSVWDVVISSPLKRSLETAEIIAAELGLPEPVILKNLHERDYGAASGLLPDERRRLFPDGRYPGQEEFEDLRIRAMKAVEDISADYTGGRIIVVSHGAFINSVLYTLSEGEFGSFKTRLKNACLNLIEKFNGRWKVVFYNKTSVDLDM